MTRLASARLCLLLAAPSSLHGQAPKKKKTPAPPSKQETAAATTGAAVLSPLLLKGLKARSIGPAIMSGRVSAIAFDPSDPFTFYVGLGTGGVMKTSDNGGTFQAVFEKESRAAIGALAVSPAAPKLVWAGTGEAMVAVIIPLLVTLGLLKLPG